MDGALVLFGGALLLTPGFLSDILGLVLLLPPTRALVRAVLVRRFADRMVASMTAPRGARRPGRGRGRPTTSRARRSTRRPTGYEPDPPSARDVIGAELEQVRTPTGPAFADAVTFAFGDAAAQLYGLARIGLSPGEDGAGRAGSALAVLFAGREPVAAIARGGARGRRTGAGWEAIALGGLRMTVDEPLRALDASTMDGERHGFDLRFEALSPPAEIAGDDAVARAGGMAGYEQLCGVTGTVRAGGRAHEVRCLGQRGHGWGEPDWEPHRGRAHRRRLARRRLGARADERAPAGRRARRASPSWAALLDEDGHAAASTTRGCRRPTTPTAASAAPGSSCGSTTTSFPARGSGEVLCGSTLDLGALRLDCAFFRWRIDGESGVGRYDVLRRAGGDAASSRSRAGPSSRARGTRPRAPRSAPRTATAARTPAPAPRRRPR